MSQTGSDGTNKFPVHGFLIVSSTVHHSLVVCVFSVIHYGGLSVLVAKGHTGAVT